MLVPLRPFLLGATLLLTTALCSSIPPASGVEAEVRASDRALLIDGTPVFPFGLYHISWVGDRQYANQRQDLVSVADAGMSLIHATLRADTHATQFLGIAQQRGVYAFAQFSWPGRATIVPFLAQHPRMVAFQAVDDFNYPPSDPKYTTLEVAQLTAAVRALAPEHLVFGSGAGCLDCVLRAYAPYLDIVSIQSYPIGNDPDSTALLWNARSFVHARDSFAGTRTSVLAALQTFAWDGARYPTRNELRNMLYAALVYEVKGVLCYTYWDEGGLLPSNAPALWDELQLLRQEVAVQQSLLLDGRVWRISTGDPYFHAAMWTDEGQALFIVLNTHRTNPWNLSLQLPVSSPGPLTPLFPGRPAGLQFQGRAASGIVMPEAVHVYAFGISLFSDSFESGGTDSWAATIP